MRSIPSPAIQVQSVNVTTVLGLAGWGGRNDSAAEFHRVERQRVFAREILKHGGEERLSEEKSRQPGDDRRSSVDPLRKHTQA